MTSLQSFTGGVALAVDFTAIERELAGLWKTASTTTDGGATPAVMRACQLNLVVCCEGAEQTARANTIVTDVTRVRPSRVLMAVVEPGVVEERLSASISAHCSFTPGAGRGKQVCCEQITINASAGSARRLPATILPLLLPDLPVVGWWPGDPTLSDELNRRLIETCDRIIVDSRRFADPFARFREMAAPGPPISDLAWHRLRGWRDLTAGLFDGPVFEEMPSRLESIRVTYAGHDGDTTIPGRGPMAAEAILLACWVASRLKWLPRRCLSGITFERQTFSEHQGTGALGQVLSLTLAAPGAVFTLRRAGVLDCVTATVDIPGTCPVPRTVRVVERDESALLCRALERAGRDPIHDEAVYLAAALQTGNTDNYDEVPT